MELTLDVMELTVHHDGEITSRTLPPGPPYIAAISEYFGVNLDARHEDL